MTDLRSLSGAAQAFTGLSIDRHDNGLYDQDWFRWTASVSGNFYFEKAGATINIRFENAAVSFGSVVSITAVNGTFTATAAGIFGGVAGTITLSPNLGFNFSTDLRLAINTTTTPHDIDLDGDSGAGPGSMSAGGMSTAGPTMRSRIR